MYTLILFELDGCHKCACRCRYKYMEMFFAFYGDIDHVLSLFNRNGDRYAEELLGIKFMGLEYITSLLLKR